MERLGGDLRRELGRLGSPAGGDVGAIAAVWRELTGETVARNAWPVRLARDGVLHVATSSSTWAFELDRLAPTLIERLRDRLGDSAPAALRFAPGPLPEPERDDPPQPVEITASDRREAAAIVAEIGDAPLRDALARVVAAALARTRSDRRF